MVIWSPGVKRRIATWGVLAALALQWGAAGSARATHEADHRFTVDGFVCAFDGKAASKTEVVVKDTRVSVGQTVETDERGYYKVTLHLHNDNVGDPLVVTANREEQRLKIEFDPKDLETERKLRVNFGTGCQQTAPDEVPRWVYYTLAAIGLVTAGWIGFRALRTGRREQRGKGQKRSRK